MGWNGDDVVPGRDGPENLRILKKSQLKVDIGPWKTRVEFSTVAATGKIFRSLQTEILNITRCAIRWNGVCIVRIVSLSWCRRTEVRN